jgi:hypothetical protein
MAADTFLEGRILASPGLYYKTISSCAAALLSLLDLDDERRHCNGPSKRRNYLRKETLHFKPFKAQWLLYIPLALPL